MEPTIRFDNTTHSHSTVMQVVAENRPDLVQRITAEASTRGCEIELALVNAHGATAVDVFYVSLRGAKLNVSQQQVLHEALMSCLTNGHRSHYRAS